ncbi:hypothetical protein CW713_05550 [Methanophagales archaeon]|nr:MAG: hypothetical protein CW713_05550 [Methanophagales archaeon]
MLFLYRLDKSKREVISLFYNRTRLGGKTQVMRTGVEVCCLIVILAIFGSLFGSVASAGNLGDFYATAYHCVYESEMSGTQTVTRTISGTPYTLKASFLFGGYGVAMQGTGRTGPAGDYIHYTGGGEGFVSVDDPVNDAAVRQRYAQIGITDFTGFGNIGLNYPSDATYSKVSEITGASGRTLIPWYSIAVDPSELSLGTTGTLLFKSGTTPEGATQMSFRADDTGGGIAGKHVDIYVGEGQSAIDEWYQTGGNRNVEVPTGDKFNIGATVRVTTNLNVRIGPGTGYPEITDPDYPGYAPAGTIGIVLSGPSSADSFFLWEVDYGPGLYSGWSVEGGLEKVDDNILPTVDAFSVTPASVTLGDAFTIPYTVSDTGGSGLKQVELWRKGTGDWEQIGDPISLVGEGDGPYSDSFYDAPPSVGTYWYGMHVVDNEGNWGWEPDPPGTIEVEVTPTPTPTPPGIITVEDADAMRDFDLRTASGDALDSSDAPEQDTFIDVYVNNADATRDFNLISAPGDALDSSDAPEQDAFIDVYVNGVDAMRDFDFMPIGNQPPTCAIEPRKNGAEIDEIDVGEFFDIYVGGSTDDTGIKEVRFSSDESQDSNPTGEWTDWYDWDTSSGDWNAETKIKKWSFATGGKKEVWAEVKDNAGQTAKCSANIITEDLYWLTKAIASEAGSVWDVDHWVRCSDEERVAVGWTVLNRFDSGKFGSSIKDVVKSGYAYNQEPKQEIITLSEDLLKREISDPTGGAMYFFSPIGMPKEGEENKCKPPIGNGIMDCGGELHQVPGTSEKVYFPSWAKPKEGWTVTDFYQTVEDLEWVSGLANVRNWYFMFYRPIMAKPVLTSPLEISPTKDTYYVGDTLSAEFTLTNIGGIPITLDKLLVGGRFNGGKLPNGEFPDFTFQSVTLQPNVPHQYTGTLELTQPGIYQFFIAYYIENPTPEEKALLDENNWNTCADLGDGLTDEDRTEDICTAPGYAIIVAGQADWRQKSAIDHSANNAYRVLRNLGFDDDHIFYLNSNQPQDVDGDGDSEVDALALLRQFENAINQVKAEIGDNPTPLVFYLTGHGLNDPDCFIFDEGNPSEGYLWVAKFQEELDKFSEGTPMLIVIGSCYSGRFITSNEGISAPNRIIITATHDDEKRLSALGLGGWYHSSDRFWGNLNKGLNVKDAFITNLWPGDRKHLWLDDNGDRVGHPPDNLGNDGALATTTTIGMVGTDDLELTSWYSVWIHSAGEVRVYDSQGRITGLVNGDVKEEIPGSVYDEENEIVAIFSPSDTYRYEVVGTATELMD